MFIAVLFTVAQEDGNSERSISRLVDKDVVFIYNGI